MQTLTISRKQLEEAMESTGIDLDNLRTDYSGRAMYGATCVAVEIANVTELAQLMVELSVAVGAEDALDCDLYDAVYLARAVSQRTRMDSMGMDLIVYWPGVQLDD